MKLLAFVFILFFSWPGFSQIEETIPHVDRTEWIANFEINDLQLAEALIFVEQKGRLYAPLEDVLRGLELKFDINPDLKSGSGWVVQVQRKVEVNFEKNFAITDGQKKNISSDDYFFEQGVCYMGVDTISEIWPVVLSFDKRRLTVKASGKEKLPIEVRLEREERRKKLSHKNKNKSEYPLIENPYSSGTFPSIDMNLSSGYDRDRLGYSQFNLTGASDLAESGLDFFFAGDTKKSVTDGRITMGRESNEGNVFGIRELRTAKVGDVTMPGINLVSNPRFERGIEISTAPLNYLTDLGYTNIDGHGSPGTEVELYRGNELIDFQIITKDGRYNFVNVPLIIGRNDFRTVTYSSNGQIEENEHTVRVEDALVKEHSGAFQFYMTESGYSTGQYLGINSPNQPSSKQTSSLFQYEYGITPLISVRAFQARMPDRQSLIDDNQFRSITSLRPLFPSTFDATLSRSQSSFMNNYTGAGLKWSALGVYWKGDAVKDEFNGQASEVSALSGFENYTLNLGHARFNNFVSAYSYFNGDFLRDKDRARLASNWSFYPGTNTDSDLQWEKKRGVLDSSEEKSIWRISQRIKKWRITNHITQTWFRGYDTNTMATRTGDLEIYTRPSRWDYTAGLSYSILEITRATSERILVGVDATSESRFDFGWQRDLNPILDTFVFQMSKKWNEFRTGLQTRWDQNNEWTVLATLTFGLAKSPTTNNLFMSPDSLATTGMIYPDIDLEKFDPETQKIKSTPLPEADLLVFNQERKSNWDRPQPNIIRGLTAGEKTDVSVSTASLPDPYWTPEKKGVSVIPRRGVILKVPMTVVETGEIEGTLKNGNEILSGVKVQLENQEHVIIAQTRTSFDGSFYFNNLMAGTYLIRKDPNQDRRWQKLNDFSRSIKITPAQLGVFGFDIQVTAEKKSQ